MKYTLLLAVLLAGVAGWGQDCDCSKQVNGCVCPGTVGTVCLDSKQCSHKPQPMDVPAVPEESAAMDWKNGSAKCPKGFHFSWAQSCSDDGACFDGPMSCSKSAYCEDKRRVLLTSEDGKKHCILFPPQEASKP